MPEGEKDLSFKQAIRNLVRRTLKGRTPVEENSRTKRAIEKAMKALPKAKTPRRLSKKIDEIIQEKEEERHDFGN